MNVFKYENTSWFRYRLTRTYCIKIDIFPEKEVSLPFITLTDDGLLILKKGFKWDGDTGALNLKCSRRASAIHDALCRLVNEDLIPETNMKYANDLYMCTCINDGMWARLAILRRWALKRYWGR